MASFFCTCKYLMRWISRSILIDRTRDWASRDSLACQNVPGPETSPGIRSTAGDTEVFPTNIEHFANAHRRCELKKIKASAATPLRRVTGTISTQLDPRTSWELAHETCFGRLSRYMPHTLL